MEQALLERAAKLCDGCGSRGRCFKGCKGGARCEFEFEPADAAPPGSSFCKPGLAALLEHRGGCTRTPTLVTIKGDYEERRRLALSGEGDRGYIVPSDPPGVQHVRLTGFDADGSCKAQRHDGHPIKVKQDQLVEELPGGGMRCLVESGAWVRIRLDADQAPRDLRRGEAAAKAAAAEEKAAAEVEARAFVSGEWDAKRDRWRGLYDKMRDANEHQRQLYLLDCDKRGFQWRKTIFESRIIPLLEKKEKHTLVPELNMPTLKTRFEAVCSVETKELLPSMDFAKVAREEVLCNAVCESAVGSIMDEAIEAAADFDSYKVETWDAIGFRGPGTIEMGIEDEKLRVKCRENSVSGEEIEKRIDAQHAAAAAEVREWRWSCGFSCCAGHEEARGAHIRAHPFCKPPFVLRRLDLEGVKTYLSSTVKGASPELKFEAIRSLAASGNEWYVQDAATRAQHLPDAQKERPGLDLSGHVLIMSGLGKDFGKVAGVYFKNIMGAVAARLIGPSDDFIPFCVSKTRTYAVFACAPPLASHRLPKELPSDGPRARLAGRAPASI